MNLDGLEPKVRCTSLEFPKRVSGIVFPLLKKSASNVLLCPLGGSSHLVSGL